jgi:hypothetical protein
MNLRTSIFSILLTLAISQFSYSQRIIQSTNHTILGSIHLTSSIDDDELGSQAHTVGIALEYRTVIDSLSDRIHIKFGVGFESVPIKREFENEGFYQRTQFNVTNSIGVYFNISDTYYLGLYTSLDIPFANKQTSQFGADNYKHSEFQFNLLNLNFSGGLNLGKIIHYKNRQFIIEVHGKALGLVGLKSNDYWHYQSGAIPYYGGIRMGFSF